MSTGVEAELEEHEVYAVTTDDPATLVAEYAGLDEDGRLVFVAGPLSPLHIPPERVIEWERLS